MRLIVIVMILAAAGSVCAGPELDRMLDYMFMDQMVPYRNPQQQFDNQRNIRLTNEMRIGQTFVTGPETARIARVRVFLAPTDQWKKGEGATLTLWDSPERKTKIGSGTNWYDNRQFHYNKMDFDLNCEAAPNTNYYFEITYAGEGDGQLGLVGVMDKTDAYQPGQGYLDGQKAEFDLCFQVHSRRKLDTVANIKRMFSRLNLDHPGLEEVKAAVEREDFETAIAKAVAYFESRTGPYAIIRPGDVVSPKASPFIEEADGLMNATWRDVDMEGFGGKKIFAHAYLSTGDHKYAKKLNDLMIEWMVNSPPPSESKIGGCPWDGTGWASLSVGLRVGHGFVAYSLIHSSPEFTTDCRLAYIVSLADHCNTLVMHGAHAGGNWSFTQNSSMLTFSMNFPEFKESETWKETASQRLTDSLRKDTLPDGPETESAFSYQRMAYNPLAHVYDDLILQRGLKTPFAGELRGILEKQAEYFMYAPMPNGITPLMGDWAHGQMRGYIEEDSKRFDRPDMLYVATAGKQGNKPKELSKLYPCAGVVTMRSDWGNASISPSSRRGSGGGFENARYLLLHGVHFGAHGHEDINSIPGLYAYGRELLTDPGSHEYGSPQHNLLGSSVSHNLLTVDGRNQNRSGDTAFRCWSTTPVADYLSSFADVYKDCPYTREVLYVRTNGAPDVRDYWIVRDLAGGSGTHSLEQRWHFALDSDLTVDEATLTTHTNFPEKGNLAVIQVGPSGLEVEPTTIDTWQDRAKLDKPPSKMPTVIYKTETQLPAAIDTVLFPFEGQTVPAASIETLARSAGGRDCIFRITQGRTDDLFVFQRLAQARRMPEQRIAFDGERLLVRRVGGKLRSAFMVRGTSLRVDDRDILKSDHRLDWVAVFVLPGTVKVYTSHDEPSLKIPIARGQKLSVQNMNMDSLLGPDVCAKPDQSKETLN